MRRHAKPIRPRLISALCLAACFVGSRPAEAAIVAEAVAGKPFGVGRVEVELPESLQPQALGPSGLQIWEKQGRALYPAIDNPAFPALVKDLLNQSPRPAVRLFGQLLDRPPKTNVYFLFQGDGPLQLTVQSQRAETVNVTPRADPGDHQRILTAWWRAYTAGPGLLQKKPDYPPIVENYLRSMLARRLGLEPPAARISGTWQDQFQQELGLMLGTESIRVAMQQQRMLGRTALHEAADQPLPQPIAPPELQIPEPAAEVKVEPIALRVPMECWYVRFGSFSNFLWFQDTLARWGGDLRNLVERRGLDYGLSQRMQRQIVLQQSALARLFGEAAIADAALVGSDMFLSEGAAVGVFLYARNSLLLGADIVRQRREAVKSGKGVTEQKISIEGREVSLLSSPDNSIRSFYAADGDYHFVTTSRALLRRFLQTASGAGALGSSREFRHARSIMPLDRDDTAFVYLSDAFFRNMVGPHYRIETARRLQAVADLELVQLAQLASAAEGKPGDALEPLVAGGFLPPEFGPRPDGSQTVLADGLARDSVRGGHGSFVPVPDVELTAVTRSEAQAYQRFAQYYGSKWGRIDPVIIGMRRHATEGGKQERVVIDIRMSPLDRSHYDFLMRWLGPPDALRLAPIPGDMVAMELVLANQRLFAGLRDFNPPAKTAPGGLLGLAGLFGEGGLLPLGGWRDLLVGYVGTAGAQPGLLDLLSRAIVTAPDASGYARSANDLWRRQFGQFTVFSLHHEVLAAVTPQLRYEQAERPAQLRLRVGDVSQARLAPLANKLAYNRSRDTSLGNLRLMHAMREQLHVPGEDCKTAAELLLDAQLVCPLRGQYVYRKTPEGTGWWTSTALEGRGGAGLFQAELPEGFQAPPLNWFRGLELDAQLMPDRLSAHVEVQMQLPPQQ